MDSSTVSAVGCNAATNQCANDVIQNNTVTYAGWAFYPMGGDNVMIRNNSVQYVDHGASTGGVHWYFYGNHIYDQGVWDDNGSEWCGSSINTGTIAAVGSGYTNGDVVTVVQSGASGGTFSLTVSGGVVTGITKVAQGTGYTAPGGSAVGLATTGGSGTGLTITITNNGCNAFHHDGVHCYSNSSSVAYIYNNRFDGMSGTNYNQPIFLEGGNASDPTRCFNTSTAPNVSYIFNNISLLAFNVNFGGAPQGSVTDLNVNSGDIYANNLNKGAYNLTGTPPGLEIQQIPNSECPTCGVSLYNNAISSLGTGLVATYSSNNNVDYNAYEHCRSVAGCFISGGGPICNGCGFLNAANATANGQPGAANLVTKTTAAGYTYEGHGIASPTLYNGGVDNDYFLLNSACVVPSTGASCAPSASSPLRAAGINLYSICNGQPNPGLGALCFDINGVARPSSAAWDIGPYQFVTGTQTPKGVSAVGVGASGAVN